MIRTILFFLVPFCLGVLGGIWAQAFLLPGLASNPAFQNLQFIKDWNAKIQVVSPVQEIVIRENEGLERLVKRLDKVVAGLESVSGSTVIRGSAFVYTSDGLAVVLSTSVPQGFQTKLYISGSELPMEAKVLKRDTKNNLVLLKIESTGLETAGVSEESALSVGERAILVGKTFEKDGIIPFVNQGVVQGLYADRIQTNIRELLSVQGSPVFDIEGKLLGLALLDQNNKVKTIPVSVLRSFLGL
ncbi:MAG: serine protease [bacterium]|nr:serine protease [bacterium]